MAEDSDNKKIKLPKMTPEAWELIEYRIEKKIRLRLGSAMAILIGLLSIIGSLLVNSIADRKVEKEVEERATQNVDTAE